MPGKVVPPPPELPHEAPPRPAVGTDVRASRLYLLSRGPALTIVRRSLSVAALVSLDVLGLALGLYAALVLRNLVYGDEIFWGLLWRARDGAGVAEWLPFLAPVTVLVFLQAGLYAERERRPGPGRIVASLVLVALIVLAIGLGTDYDFQTTGLIPTAVATCSLAIGVLRAAYGSIGLELLQLAGIRRRALLVGGGGGVERVRSALAAQRGGIPYAFVGALPASSLDALSGILARERPDEVILVEQDFGEEAVLEAVERAHRAGVKVRLAPTTTELLVREGEYVPGQGVPLFELRPPVLSGVDWLVKRVFDLAVSAGLVVGAMPLWLLLALAVKIETRGPVFYVDRRVGVGEREFGMIKFRTMIAGAAEQQAPLEAANEASGALFKIREDPRVTRVGRVLRRFSLDEMPQLLNVLRGEMSLVGPRPLPLRDYRLLSDWHRKRYLVLPGMTGLWQISGRSGLSFDDLVRLDFTYLENWSIWLDITILARTLPAVLSGKGAY